MGQWFCLFGVFTLACALGFVTHRNRREFRKFRCGVASHWLRVPLCVSASLAFVTLSLAVATALQASRTLVVGTVSTAFAVLTICLTWLVDRRQSDIRGRTCPVCLGIDTLRPAANHALSDIETYPRGALKCVNHLVTDDKYGDETEEECDFTFPAAIQKLPHLRFATIGVTNSGTTVWLTSLYAALMRQSPPNSLILSCVQNESTRELAANLDGLDGGEVPPATQAARLPRPFLVWCTDSDSWGTSEVLAHVSESPGAVFSFYPASHLHRRCMLQANGFTMFIDPTQDFESQASAIYTFLTDLKMRVSPSPRQQIRCPIAVVLSKVDLLINKSSDFSVHADIPIDALKRDLENTPPPTDPCNLATIERRSERLSLILKSLWSSYPALEQHLRTVSKCPVRFFPLASFGIHKSAPPPSSDALPIGILEPLLWLLHCHGYRVLDDGNVGTG